MKAKNLNLDRASKKAQMKRDHQEHYDMDGVTRRNGKIVIPSNVDMKKEEHGKENKGSVCKVD